MPHETAPPDPTAGAEPPADTSPGAAAETAVAPAAPDASAAAGVPEAAEGQAGPEAAAAAAPEMTAAACAARLAELFPALFGADGPPRPVKLRVHADVQQRAPGVFTRRVLSTFLARHTTTSAYLRGLVESPHRFDLDGQPAGEIADEHRQAAREELARRRALRRGPPGNGRRPAAAGGPAPLPPGADAAAPTDRDAAARPPRGPRPERPARSGPPGRPGRRERPAPGPERAGRPPRPSQPAGPSATGRVGDTPGADARLPAAPFDPAQRARQALVRAWESSPLAKPNFCALMRVTPAELDAAIEQVQQERRTRADVRAAR
jgi:sRNA-binding protein